jgi:hypothetical protein
MKKSLMLLIAITSLLFSSCGIIEIAPSHTEGYSSNIDEYSYQGLTLTEVRLEQVDSIIGGRKLYLWAPWCVHCLVKLDEMNKDAIGERYVMVSTSYDIKRIHKVLSKRPNLLQGPLYVIDAHAYGVTESERISKFGRELGVDSLRGVPHTFQKIEGQWTLLKKE